MKVTRGNRGHTNVHQHHQQHQQHQQHHHRPQLFLSITIASDVLWLMKIISLTMILGGTLVADFLWNFNQS